MWNDIYHHQNLVKDAIENQESDSMIFQRVLKYL